MLCLNIYQQFVICLPYEPNTALPASSVNTSADCFVPYHLDGPRQLYG